MLLEKLIAKQQELGCTDRDFAGRLGVPRSTWQLTRTKKVTLGLRVVRGAQKAFPDLAPEAAIFLLFGANEGAAPANTLTSRRELIAT